MDFTREFDHMIKRMIIPSMRFLHLPAIRGISICAALFLVLLDPLHADGLRNLNEEKPAPRFEVTDPVWPEKPGEAVVCLWEDDKLAAISVGVDDNNAGDVEWWLKEAGERGIPVTWFLVSGLIGTRASGGSADLWRSVCAAGHDVQSHSVTHLADVGPEWKGIDWEYSESVRQIEECVPGKSVRLLAYPGGPNMGRNDRAIAAKHFLAARGTVGTPNPANATDYLNVNAMSRCHAGENPEMPWCDLNNVLDRSRENGRFYRGWAFPFFHTVKSETAIPILDFYVNNKDRIWAALFLDVARYGQERDTAELTTAEAGADRIALGLTDRMDDRYYDYPLTLKVRLPEGWTAIQGEQGGRPLTTKTVRHDGAVYGLVQAIPDQGTIILTRPQQKIGG